MGASLKSYRQVQRALELSNAGWNNCQIGREMGVNRRTVSDWVRGRTRRKRREPPAMVPSYPYAYLLGLYLGDGHIARHPRDVYRLRIFLDRSYPLIVAECGAAIGLCMPNKVGIVRRRAERVNEVYSFSKHWPQLFPQHGAGRKHERKIVLEPWQRLIVDRHPGRLLRGLIHSDGCRVVNRVRHPQKTYAYPRYFFSNRSLDIQGVFCDACDRLGVSWRQDGPWNISVARRDSVAILDRHIGPKC